MKIFVKVSPARHSINFADEKNRVIGWCAEQICCESHYCRLTNTEPEVCVDPAGSYVDDECAMTPEEVIRFNNGEKIYRPIKWAEVKNVRFDLSDLENVIIDLRGWEIDPDYVKDIGWQTVVFRLFKDNEQMFVVLQNHHNGYYSHGFNLKVGGEIKVEGCL